MIPVAFRFDDLSPSSNQALERKIIDVFLSNACRVTAAVVPFSRVNGCLVGLTQERTSYLLDAVNRGTMEIALHGFSHERRGSDIGGKPSEFAGLAPTEQFALISDGLLRLREIFGDRICGFVPPWNTFDVGTLDILERLAFRYMSAAWEGPLEYRGAMVLVPRTCNLASLRAALKEARRFRLLSPTIVTAMHHYDFSESTDNEAIIDLAAFDRLLKWLTKQPDVAILPLGEITNLLTLRKWRQGFKYHRLRQALHWRFQRYIPHHIFMSASPWSLIAK